MQRLFFGMNRHLPPPGYTIRFSPLSAEEQIPEGDYLALFYARTSGVANALYVALHIDASGAGSARVDDPTWKTAAVFDGTIETLAHASAGSIPSFSLPANGEVSVRYTSTWTPSITPSQLDFPSGLGVGTFKFSADVASWKIDSVLGGTIPSWVGIKLTPGSTGQVQLNTWYSSPSFLVSSSINTSSLQRIFGMNIICRRTGSGKEARLTVRVFQEEANNTGGPGGGGGGGGGGYFVHVNQDKCVLCGSCVEVCPTSVFKMDKYGPEVDSSSCLGCGACLDSCPVEALKLEEH